MTDKANILVLGTSGSGKSTLINAVIGKEVAKVSNGPKSATAGKGPRSWRSMSPMS